MNIDIKPFKKWLNAGLPLAKEKKKYFVPVLGFTCKKCKNQVMLPPVSRAGYGIRNYFEKIFKYQYTHKKGIKSKELVFCSPTCLTEWII